MQFIILSYIFDFIHFRSDASPFLSSMDINQNSDFAEQELKTESYQINAIIFFHMASFIIIHYTLILAFRPRS